MQAIIHVLEGKISVKVPKFHELPDLTVQTCAVSVFDQMSPATMAKDEAKDSVLGLAIQYVCKGGTKGLGHFKKLHVRQYESACCNLIDW